MTTRTARAIAMSAVALVTLLLVVASPLRPLSGDTVPGRVGGLVLRCTGTFELDRVDWIAAETTQDRMFYYMQKDFTHEFTSLFGPVPSLVGVLGVLDVGEGDALSDASLRTRERVVSALLVGLAAALLLLAASARMSVARATLLTMVVVLSYAGAASLGQGLWQATPALPCLSGALAALTWREQVRWTRVVPPALLVATIMIRPAIGPLALGIGLAWATETGRDRRTWLIATICALVVAAPFVVWNALHQHSPLSLAQWQGNRRLADHVFTVGSVPVALAGLVVSPARGLLWFAPIVLAGVGYGLRDRKDRWIAIGALGQVVLMATFFKWHGGQAFGPRLLSELVWVTPLLVAGGRPVVLAAPALVTVFVGQIGLWAYRPEQWEQRRLPDRHPAALWDVADSPIPAALTGAGSRAASPDHPPVGVWHCEDRRVRTSKS